jgi:DNA-binding transcriptional MerR regulator
MRELLTIGEIAKLLNIATSRIRYYERAELIKPDKIDDNGYRLYGFSQLDTLEFIILLKDINVPLAKIKQLIDIKKPYDYHSIINQSINAVNSELELLNKKKKWLEKKRDDFTKFNESIFEIIHMSERKIHIIAYDKDREVSIREFYEMIQRNNVNYLDCDYDAYWTSSEDATVRHCIYNKTGKMDNVNMEEYHIPCGKFLTYRTKMLLNDESFDSVDVLIKEAVKENIHLVGDKIIIEDLNTLLFSREERYVTVQMRIDD